MRRPIAPSTMLLLLAVVASARADGAVVSSAFKTGSVYDCRVTETTTLVFNGKDFLSSASKDNVRVQIKILKTELEMTLTSAPSGEIYVEKDLILARTPDGQSVFAIYQAPMGNVVSIALHALKNADIILTQSRTYRELLRSTVYQSTASGKCRQLSR